VSTERDHYLRLSSHEERATVSSPFMAREFW
jgi:hypothetical protein